MFDNGTIQISSSDSSGSLASAAPHPRTTIEVTNVRDARAIRRKMGVNQQTFWSKLGVTQSGGSRYESGRNMPRPVKGLAQSVNWDSSMVSANHCNCEAVLPLA